MNQPCSANWFRVDRCKPSASGASSRCFKTSTARSRWWLYCWSWHPRTLHNRWYVDVFTKICVGFGSFRFNKQNWGITWMKKRVASDPVHLRDIKHNMRLQSEEMWRDPRLNHGFQGVYIYIYIYLSLGGWDSMVFIMQPNKGKSEEDSGKQNKQCKWLKHA